MNNALQTTWEIRWEFDSVFRYPTVEIDRIMREPMVEEYTCCGCFSAPSTNRGCFVHFGSLLGGNILILSHKACRMFKVSSCLSILHSYFVFVPGSLMLCTHFNTASVLDPQLVVISEAISSLLTEERIISVIFRF